MGTKEMASRLEILLLLLSLFSTSTFSKATKHYLVEVDDEKGDGKNIVQDEVEEKNGADEEDELDEPTAFNRQRQTPERQTGDPIAIAMDLPDCDSVAHGRGRGLGRGSRCLGK